MNDKEEIDYRSALIEALARLEAIENSIGDLAMGMWCVPSVNDLSSVIYWMHSLYRDPPDWSSISDPLFDLPDDLWDEAEERGNLLRRRARRELIAYHERLKDDWKPYWRRMPIGSGIWTDEQRNAYIQSDDYDPLGLS